MKFNFDEDGRLIYRKKDGTEADIIPTLNNRLQKYGFKIVEDAEVVWGIPHKDDKIIVENWKGYWLLEKGARGYQEMNDEVGEALENDKITDENVLEFVVEADLPPTEKNPDDYREKRALEVVRLKKDYFIDGKFRPGNKYFKNLPKDWQLLEKGDGLLTRAVQREGRYWLVKEYDYYTHQVRIGIIALSRIIKQKRLELGGDIGKQKREKKITNQLCEAIKKEFPKIPEDDLERVLDHCRASGRVGSCKEVYFASKSRKAELLSGGIASLAVEAHIRHNCTDYDESFDKVYEELSDDEINVDEDGTITNPNYVFNETKKKIADGCDRKWMKNYPNGAIKMTNL